MVKIVKPHLLVVGGTGFIGFHLMLAAKKRGWIVINQEDYRKSKKGIRVIRFLLSFFLTKTQGGQH